MKKNWASNDVTSDSAVMKGRFSTQNAIIYFKLDHFVVEVKKKFPGCATAAGLSKPIFIGKLIKGNNTRHARLRNKLMH